MINWSLAGAVILSGLILVFTVLIVLILVVTIAGKLSGSTQKAQPAPVPAAPKAAPVNSPAVSAAPAPANGVPGEHIAAISAAVAAMMEQESPGVSYTITNIQRTRGDRPIWGFAGMQQNTRPF